jgi:hypothetical protein
MLLIKQMSLEHAAGREGLLICRSNSNDGMQVNASLQRLIHRSDRQDSPIVYTSTAHAIMHQLLN